MPVISPFVASVLLAVAGIAATYVTSARRLSQAAGARPVLAQLACYGLGVLLGPGLGLVDPRLLEAASPALVLAAAWVAARAGSQMISADGLLDRRNGLALADALAAWLLPAAALYAAVRYLPPAVAPAWEPRLPVLATLAAAISLASGAHRRLVAVVALCALLVALIPSLPDGRIWRVPRQAVWVAVGLLGIGFTAVVWGWIARRGTTPIGSAVVGLAIGAGIGLAAGLSPLVVCALAAAILAGRSLRRTIAVRDVLVRSEAAASAVVWVAAGVQFGGGLGPLVVAVAALSLWPLMRRLMTRMPIEPDRTLGLVVVLSYVWTTHRGDAAPLVTVVALGSLLIGMLTASRRAGQAPLTSGLASVEVSV